MNLFEILSSAGLSTDGLADTQVTGVTQFIEKVEKGSVFVAVRGKNSDGNSFTEAALRKGAAAVISDSAENLYGVIKVPDSRACLGELASAFYSHPEKKMNIIGVTGTNGKTTVSHYIKHLIEFAGEKCGIIGTLGSFCEGFSSETGYTTPVAEELFYELDKISASGAHYCVMEVSSQALHQKRTGPLEFSLGVLTNIGHDHLDYHGTAENYMNCKAELFRNSKKALINMDDAYCDMFGGISPETYFYSSKFISADFIAKNIITDQDGLRYIFLGKDGFSRFRLNITGEIALYNSLAAACAVSILGFSPEKFCEGMSALPVVRGRMEKFSDGKRDVYIDFAHTPEALFSVLSDLGKNKKGRLICVFGCGGDRDPSKRSEMGSVASRLADTVVITTDNPRNEDPEKIADDVYKGIKYKNNTYRIADREEAIAFAVSSASEGDTVLIAGKGHENYQIACGEKLYFSDEEILKKYLF